jgi:AcrR family transcriptional regulator
MTQRERSVGRRPAAVAEATREHIVRAARGLFARHGFDAVSVRDIAEQAGTTHGLVRHHFGSKLGVWQAVVDAAEAEYAGALGPVLDGLGSGDARDEAAHFVRRFVAVSALHPDLTRLLLHEGTAAGPRLPQILAHLASAHRRLEPLVARLHACGLLRQFGSETLFHFLLFAAGAPFALPALSEGLLGPDASAEAHAERVVHALLGL